MPAKTEIDKSEAVRKLKANGIQSASEIEN